MVTTLTPPPVVALSRASGDEFDNNITSWLSWHQTQYTEYASLSAELAELASNAESAASELANAAWSSGSYTTGDVVYSPTNYLNYRAKTTGVLTTDPSLDEANWALLTGTSEGGSETTSSTTNTTLTTNSDKVQIISKTAADKYVKLPSASTLNKGGPLFSIYNDGLYPFKVIDGADNFLAVLNPTERCHLSCTDTSSIAGLWHSEGHTTNLDISSAAEVLLSDPTITGGSYDSSTQVIDNNTSLLIYQNNTGPDLYGMILKTDGTSNGLPVKLTTQVIPNIGIVSATILNPTTAMIVWRGTSTYLYAQLLSISGTTITSIGASEITVYTGASDKLSITKVNSSKAVVAHSRGSDMYLIVLSYSGSTISAGSAVLSGSSTGIGSTAPEIIMLSESTGIVMYVRSGTLYY